MACDEARINVDWQFNVNTWEDDQDAPCESPLLGGIVSFGAFRRYDRDAQRMVLSIPDADNVAIESLAYGQRHSPRAQQTYRDFVSRIGIYAFFRLVVSAAPGRPSDFTEANVNINWQIVNSPGSINAAQTFIVFGQHVTDPEARDYFNISAMRSLMEGQHHSAGVMQLYRACFRDDADQLFDMLVALDLRSPAEKLAEFLLSIKPIA